MLFQQLSQNPHIKLVLMFHFLILFLNPHHELIIVILLQVSFSHTMLLYLQDHITYEQIQILNLILNPQHQPVFFQLPMLNLNEHKFLFICIFLIFPSNFKLLLFHYSLTLLIHTKYLVILLLTQLKEKLNHQNQLVNKLLKHLILPNICKYLEYTYVLFKM